jgi:DNA polymerase alpha subunit B
LCRILNDEEIDTKEGILSSPTDRSQRVYSEPFDSTPQTNGNIFSSGKTSKLVTPFGQRTNKFLVKFSINNAPNTENIEKKHDQENNEDDIIKRVQPRMRCSLIVHGSGPEPGCRFMYDRIEDRVCKSYYSMGSFLFFTFIYLFCNIIFGESV